MNIIISMFSLTFDLIDFSHKLDGHTLPSNDFKKHMHDFYELLFFVRGKVDYVVDSESKNLIPCDVVLISPGALHYGTADTDTSYERFVLKFPTSILPTKIAEEIVSIPYFAGNYPFLKQYFDELEKIYHEYDHEHAYLLMIGVLIRILIDIKKRYQNNYTPEVHQNEIVAQIIQYINLHINQNIRLEDICEELHFSRSYVSTEFAKVMKVPVMTYIRYKKIIAASQKIAQGGVKINEVAEEYGFTEYSTFYRNYKKIIGRSPFLKSNEDNK